MLPKMIASLQQTDAAYVSVRNNAAWAIGEIAMKYREFSCLVALVFWHEKSGSLS
jgi:hypothetical protein